MELDTLSVFPLIYYAMPHTGSVKCLGIDCPNDWNDIGVGIFLVTLIQGTLEKNRLFFPTTYSEGKMSMFVLSEF